MGGVAEQEQARGEPLTALVLARRQRGRRKGEALHLRRLGQQWPSSGVRGHAVWVCSRAVPGDCACAQARRVQTAGLSGVR